jgi:hypothetical protein
MKRDSYMLRRLVASLLLAVWAVAFQFMVTSTLATPMILTASCTLFSILTPGIWLNHATKDMK